MTEAPAPGTRWIKRGGKHADNTIEIVKTSELSVYVLNRGGGESMGNQKADDSKTYRITREAFARDWVPATSLVAGDAHGGGRAFRQNNQARSKQITLEPGVAEAAVAPARNNGHHISTRDSGLSVAVETITPALAREWLERGGANRHLSERRVQMLVAAIQGGEWQLTGDSIKLDAEGKVRDGQHRLEACARSGISIQALVVRNVTEEAFNVIDTGRSRTASDVLAIHGFKNTVASAAATRGLMLIERNGRYAAGGPGGFVPPPSSAAILAYVAAHPEIGEAVRLGLRLRAEADYIGGAGLWAVALAMFWRISPEQTEVFVESLIEGANLEKGSPILRLRNMYMGSAREWHSSNENRERLLATVIKGWNAWRNNELVQQLSWHNTGRAAEKFPEAE